MFGSIFFFVDGLYFDVNLDDSRSKPRAFCWYKPVELSEILAPMLGDVPPARAVAPFSEVPKQVLSDVIDIRRLAKDLEAELADGSRWITGTWWTKPRIMRGGGGWLGLEVDKRRLTGVARWDDTSFRSELTKILLLDRAAHAEPVDARLRSQALEHEAKAEAELEQLVAGPAGWEIADDPDSTLMYVRDGDEFIAFNAYRGHVHELFWASREHVLHKMLATATAGKRGTFKAVDDKLRKELADKTDRSRYMAMMRSGKLKVGAVPFQTDSEWWLLFKNGKFWHHSGMDDDDYEVSEAEAAAILRDHAYTYVSFEG
jgi:hypothetical protein